MKILEVGNLNYFVVMIVVMWFGPPLFFGALGWLFFVKKQKLVAKILWILAGIYLLIGLGICGSFL